MTTTKESLDEALVMAEQCLALYIKRKESIERCEKDKFPHTPLVVMYKRPPQLPD